MLCSAPDASKALDGLTIPLHLAYNSPSANVGH